MEKRQTPQSAQQAQRTQRTLERGLEPSCFQGSGLPARRRSRNDLHVCPTCASQLVYPVSWETVDRTRWIVSLRCPECEWSGGGTYDQSVLERFDEVLDRGTEAVLEDLRALARANMEEEIDRFVAALDSGHILPEDF